MAKVSAVTSSLETTTAEPAQTQKKTRFEGIELTDPINSLLEKAYEIIPSIPTNAYSIQKVDETKQKHDTVDVMANMNALQVEIAALSQTTKLTIEHAISVLKQQQQQSQTKEIQFISILTLRAMETIFDYVDDSSNPDAPSSIDKSLRLSLELERTLQNHPTQLVYSTAAQLVSSFDQSLNRSANISNDTPQTSLTKQQMKFQQRMHKLRLKQEERKYMKITNNIGNNTVQNDDITVKSMTYAASIGLNMIVAPISFGVFMYFFAGSLLDYFWPSRSSSPSTTDIKKVIAGVVSGVLMLFIEMILFVIRTHELDKAMAKKRKKKGDLPDTLSPFGHYKSTTAKSYVDR
jgi:uncharacterized protein YerC